MKITMKDCGIIAILLLFNLISYAQEEIKEPEDSSFGISVTSDLVSRHVWRGQPFDETFCIQPNLSFSLYNFTLGAWGSYSLSKNITDELDLFVTFTLPTKSGSLLFSLWDFYNPNEGVEFSNYKGDGEGAHILELSGGYNGPEDFPISFLAAYNIHNDVSKSLYFELGYNFNVKDIKLNAFFGVAKGENPDWYNIEKDKFGITNIGLSATRNIKITSDFSIPLIITYVINSYTEKSYLVLKLSI